MLYIILAIVSYDDQVFDPSVLMQRFAAKLPHDRWGGVEGMDKGVSRVHIIN